MRLKADSEQVVDELARKDQEVALNAVLKLLQAENIAIPKEKLKLFPPRAFGFNRSRESFKGNTGVAFDALGAPATSSDLTLSLLFHPQRAARLVQQKALDQDQLGLEEMIEKVLEETVKNVKKDEYLQEVQNVINYNVLQHLLNLAVHENSSPQVKAVS